MKLTRAQALAELGLEDGASEDEIKKTYKKLALQWHPDKNADKEAATVRFQMISAAYARLSARNHPGDDDDLDDLRPEDIFDEHDFEEFEDLMRSEFFCRMFFGGMRMGAGGRRGRGGGGVQVFFMPGGGLGVFHGSSFPGGCGMGGGPGRARGGPARTSPYRGGGYRPPGGRGGSFYTYDSDSEDDDDDDDYDESGSYSTVDDEEEVQAYWEAAQEQQARGVPKAAARKDERKRRAREADNFFTRSEEIRRNVFAAAPDPGLFKFAGQQLPRPTNPGGVRSDSSIRVSLDPKKKATMWLDNKQIRFELDYKRAVEAAWVTLSSETSATFDVAGLSSGTRYVFRGRAGTWIAGGADGKEMQLQWGKHSEESAFSTTGKPGAAEAAATAAAAASTGAGGTPSSRGAAAQPVRGGKAAGMPSVAAATAAAAANSAAAATAATSTALSGAGIKASAAKGQGPTNGTTAARTTNGPERPATVGRAPAGVTVAAGSTPAGTTCGAAAAVQSAEEAAEQKSKKKKGKGGKGEKDGGGEGEGVGSAQAAADQERKRQAEARRQEDERQRAVAAEEEKRRAAAEKDAAMRAAVEAAAAEYERSVREAAAAAVATSGSVSSKGAKKGSGAAGSAGKQHQQQAAATDQAGTPAGVAGGAGKGAENRQPQQRPLSQQQQKQVSTGRAGDRAGEGAAAWASGSRNIPPPPQQQSYSSSAPSSGAPNEPRHGRPGATPAASQGPGAGRGTGRGRGFGYSSSGPGTGFRDGSGSRGFGAGYAGGRGPSGWQWQEDLELELAIAASLKTAELEGLTDLVDKDALAAINAEDVSRVSGPYAAKAAASPAAAVAPPSVPEHFPTLPTTAKPRAASIAATSSGPQAPVPPQQRQQPQELIAPASTHSLGTAPKQKPLPPRAVVEGIPALPSAPTAAHISAVATGVTAIATAGCVPAGPNDSAALAPPPVPPDILYPAPKAYPIATKSSSKIPKAQPFESGASKTGASKPSPLFTVPYAVPVSEPSAASAAASAALVTPPGGGNAGTAAGDPRIADAAAPTPAPPQQSYGEHSVLSAAPVLHQHQQRAMATAPAGPSANSLPKPKFLNLDATQPSSSPTTMMATAAAASPVSNGPFSGPAAAAQAQQQQEVANQAGSGLVTGTGVIGLSSVGSTCTGAFPRTWGYSGAESRVSGTAVAPAAGPPVAAVAQGGDVRRSVGVSYPWLPFACTSSPLDAQTASSTAAGTCSAMGPITTPAVVSSAAAANGSYGHTASNVGKSLSGNALDAARAAWLSVNNTAGGRSGNAAGLDVSSASGSDAKLDNAKALYGSTPGSSTSTSTGFTAGTGLYDSSCLASSFTATGAASGEGMVGDAGGGASAAGGSTVSGGSTALRPAVPSSANMPFGSSAEYGGLSTTITAPRGLLFSNPPPLPTHQLASSQQPNQLSTGQQNSMPSLQQQQQQLLQPYQLAQPYATQQQPQAIPQQFQAPPVQQQQHQAYQQLQQPVYQQPQQHYARQYQQQYQQYYQQQYRQYQQQYAQYQEQYQQQYQQQYAQLYPQQQHHHSTATQQLQPQQQQPSAPLALRDLTQTSGVPLGSYGAGSVVSGSTPAQAPGPANVAASIGGTPSVAGWPVAPNSIFSYDMYASSAAPYGVATIAQPFAVGGFDAGPGWAAGTGDGQVVGAGSVYAAALAAAAAAPGASGGGTAVAGVGSGGVATAGGQQHNNFGR